MPQSNENIPEQVIRHALYLLASIQRWNRDSNYGEVCLPNSNTYTLGCALELSQLSIRGVKQPRAKEMRVVRRKILRYFLFRGHLHSYSQKTIK